MYSDGEYNVAMKYEVLIKSKVSKGLRKFSGWVQKKKVVNDDEVLLNIFETKWYKEIKKTITPGETLKIYRENIGLNQTELGKKLGKFTRQNISDMESGKRNISKEVAKKLSLIFEVTIDKFI